MPTLINVCGPGRTGTTMVDLMLGNADNAFSCGEAYAWFRPWRPHHRRINCASCKPSPCSKWDMIKDLPEHRFHSQAAQTLGVDFMIDSSKDLCWVIDTQDWAKKSELRIFNLLLWKHPVQLAYSHWKRGRGLDAWHRRFLNYYTRFLALDLPFVSLCVDELVESPAVKMRQACEQVGMSYFAGKERFWEGRHHHLFGSTATRQQVEARESEFRTTQFEPEFEVLLDELNQMIAADPKIDPIMQALRQQDVSRQAEDPSASGVPVPVRRRPPWYYTRRRKKMLQRLLPQSVRPGR